MVAPNKRLHKRYSMELTSQLGSIYDSETDYPFPAVVRNVSLGGAYLETPAPYHRGDLVGFTVNLPGDRRRNVTGRVCWRRHLPPSGIGVEFIRNAIVRDMMDSRTIHR
jgi:Tfp pilus assembly protein PilZ